MKKICNIFLIIAGLVLYSGLVVSMVDDDSDQEKMIVPVPAYYDLAVGHMQNAVNAIGHIDEQNLDDEQRDTLNQLHEQLGEEINNLN